MTIPPADDVRNPNNTINPITRAARILARRHHVPINRMVLLCELNGIGVDSRPNPEGRGR